tara:strand:+ start:2034 stop:3272 length:1239 start_codon:yes stop_codon:yes gene_type:complete
MADVINEGDSKIEVIDSGSPGDAEITAVLNNVERAEITSTLISLYNTTDQMETGNATDDQNGAASTFNGFQVNDATLRLKSGNGSSVPHSNLYFDGKSIISDKTLSIGTTGQKELHFGTNGTKWVKITEGGFLDFAKMTIGGSQGTAGQYLRNAGNGTIEWSTIDSNNAFGTVTVGATNLNAGSVGDTFTIAAGSNITLTPNSGNNTLTIASTQTNSFDKIAVSGQSNVVGDSATDTLTFVAGSGMTITTDASTDTVTFTSSATSGSTEDVFKNIAVAGQSTLTADSATDTLTAEAGDGIEITTDDGTGKLSFKNEALKRLSKYGYLTYTKANGTSEKVPLKNFFINQTVTQSVNGGGSSAGMSTRAFRLLQSDGSTFSFMIMPATTSGDSLTFTYTKADGSTVTKDITMAA